MSTSHIHADLIREIISYDDHETAWAVIETLRMSGAPTEQCDRLQEHWLQRQRGKCIIADATSGEWLIATAYRDGEAYEIQGAGE